MTIRTLSALAALAAFSAAASAQTLDSSAADGAALVSHAREARHGYDAKQGGFAADGAPQQYARTIVCAHPPKESGLGSLSFFTGLAPKAKRIKGDDTASALDDYRRAYLDGGKFHYDAWSCDTQDYYFTFDAESLLKATAGEKSRSIKGRGRIETRGQVDWEGELDCVANW